MSSSVTEDTIRAVVGRARSSGREVLLEPEAREILGELGISMPREIFVTDPDDLVWAAAVACDDLPGDEVVVKVISEEILHKTDIGGVRFVEKTEGALVPLLEDMWSEFAEYHPGLLISERIQYDKSPGGELLLGLRWTADFGPVVTMGLGGVATEFLAENLRPGVELAAIAAGLTDRAGIERALSGKVFTPLVTGGVRRIPARIEKDALVDLIERFARFTESWMPETLEEIEINPLLLTPQGPFALDALVRIGRPASEAIPRPIDKIGKLLRPESVAVVGVSKSMNPGRVIVGNLVREGFDRERITIVKPGVDEIEGCRCVPELEDLPAPVDLMVLAIAAEQVPDAISRIVDGRLAESVIVIPGGLGESESSKDLEARVQSELDRSRSLEWRGPVVNGGNCLGVRSVPGRYDTMFLPSYKVPHSDGPSAPLAFVSQSGAFTIAKGSKFEGIEPAYVVSIGNQIDLTVGDYMQYLEADPGVEMFAFYVEGFKAGDGRRWLDSAERATKAGRPVILYRAGRTPEGSKASASHTAAIAGDFVLTRELARNAGVVVAESLDEFEDLVRLFVHLHGRAAKGNRLGAVSNAGFETVAVADNLDGLDPVSFSPATVSTVSGILEQARLDRIVTVANPLDVNPLLGDEGFALVAEAVLNDPEVDLGLIGCVPLTGALHTLPPGEEHEEDLYRPDSVVGRLVELWARSSKPWVAVVDSGRLFDPMARRLEECGIPTFRSADRATRTLAKWVSWRRSH